MLKVIKNSYSNNNNSNTIINSNNSYNIKNNNNNNNNVFITPIMFLKSRIDNNSCSMNEKVYVRITISNLEIIKVVDGETIKTILLNEIKQFDSNSSIWEFKFRNEHDQFVIYSFGVSNATELRFKIMKFIKNPNNKSKFLFNKK